jgi:KaiC/GvpD/RAD55 family RecA-like ATPase
MLLSCVHGLPVLEEYDYGDNNTSDVDASADNGAHSNFIYQQYCPDGIYDIAIGADTEGNETLDLYVDIFDNTRTGWTKHGTDPYLDAQDYPTEYVWMGLDRTQSIGDFSFQNSSKSSETINSVTLRVYAWKEDSQDTLWVYLWDNSSWGNAYNVARTPAGWTEFDVTSRLDTWAKIDIAKIYFNGDTTQAENYRLFVDCAMLRINYALAHVRHDVSIVSVTPSATDVDIGQVVNITVIVKNEGNATETFNVTLYCDNNIIGTQKVTDLAPNANQTLTFIWDTIDTTPDISYTIKAEAEVLLEETDIDDNAYIGDAVAVKSQFVPTPFDWSPILQYVLPIILGFFSFLSVGIVWKKRRTGPTPSDFDYFNEITAGGIPDGYSVMIIGGESSGKSILCQQLIHTYLSKEKPCIYVTYDCFPDEVRKNMKSFNWETARHEHKGIFKFIDCYSPAAEITSEEENFVEFPFSLSDLGVAMSEVMDRVKHKSTKIFFDSTAPIFTRLEPSTVVEFLQDRSAKAKGNNSNFFYTVGKGTIPPALIHRLNVIVDCIIELDFEEENGTTSRKMRIRKLRGRRCVNTWVSFNIKSGKGIVFPSPTIHK